MPDQTFIDTFASFEGGMQSGVSPLILQKNQYAIGVNLSIRGGFIHTRPPYEKKTLAFPDSSLSLITAKKFQGAGYYRPDYGTESLLAQIDGRLIKFTETGSNWEVTDVSVPGDPNSSSPSQIWMWQAEKWMIIEDGSGVLPIFYDGTTSRRSYGDSKVLATTAADFTPPNPRVIGEIIQVVLTAPYTGPYDVPVLFNKEFYQTKKTSGDGYLVQLTNLSAIAGSTIKSGSQIVVQPSLIGYLTSSITTVLIGNSGYGFTQAPAVTDTNYVFNPSQKLVVGSDLFQGGTAWVQFGVFTSKTFPVGTLIQNGSPQGPSVIQGTVNADFIVPPAGNSVTVKLSSPYSGANNQTVWIGNDQFSISSIQTSSSANTLNLVNLSDTSTTTIPAGTEILSIPEIPAGRMGAYGNGRNGFSLTDGISYQASDIVGGASGTEANNYRDAVLKMTENVFLSGGGSFRLPGTGDIITAMTFPAQMDTSLGNGQLEIFTAFSGFSNNWTANREEWAALTFPIQTENLKGRGALGQNSTIDVNSDTFFRSSIGIGSLIIARRDFINNSWGNKPISNEMQRVLNLDNQNLLQYGSAANFDNRFLNTCSPAQTGQGVAHIGLVSMNMDLLSSLRGDVPPSWEGVWTGLNVLQVLTGRVNGSIRTFAFTLNLISNNIELYELLEESTTKYLDNGITPITTVFETGVAFNKDVKQMTQLVKLSSGKLHLSELKGDVRVKVYYKPDFYPCWTLWRDFTLCSNVGNGNERPGYKMPIQLGEPSIAECQTENNRQLNFGYFFQFRFEITGSFKFNAFYPKAVAIATPDESVVGCEAEECQTIACDLPDDLRAYSLQGLPPP